MLSTSCAICARPLTINETDPRFCPRCKTQPAKTRDALEERIIVQEEALAAAYKDFYAELEAADLDTLTRYHILLEAREKCKTNDELWATQRRREAKTLERSDGLAEILAAELRLGTQCERISIAIDDATAQIWDLDQLPAGYTWELPEYLAARRRALPALRVPGQPQLLGVAVVDPRPTVEQPAAPARVISRCRSCEAPVVWSTTPAGKKCPYDVDEQGNKTDVSHFATCPNAKSHSKATPKAKKQAVAA